MQICSLGGSCTAVTLMSKFRTPDWRPFRAAMFVLMGLSAIFPVLHGLRLYGVSQMRNQIGLSWLVLQGVLYILGAGIYAVKPYHIHLIMPESDVINRLACLRSGLLENMISGAARIRSSMYWWS
jgi:predicted membrane channel-forming protein YqfA (hemolysin III family)